MKAIELIRRRMPVSDEAFVDIVIWQLAQGLRGSAHRFKYRLAYVVGDDCVLRYDNEAGKGDHKHYRGAESPYAFVSTGKLMADFYADIQRWNHENRHP